MYYRPCSLLDPIMLQLANKILVRALIDNLFGLENLFIRSKHKIIATTENESGFSFFAQFRVRSVRSHVKNAGRNILFCRADGLLHEMNLMFNSLYSAHETHTSGNFSIRKLVWRVERALRMTTLLCV